MWSSYSVTDRPPVTGTSSNCNSSIVSSNSREIIEEDVDGTGSSPFFGLVALQLTLLIFISAMGTFANALVFAVFYRRPSLRTISNRSVFLFPARPNLLFTSLEQYPLPDQLRGLCRTTSTLFYIAQLPHKRPPSSPTSRSYKLMSVSWIKSWTGKERGHHFATIIAQHTMNVAVVVVFFSPGRLLVGVGYSLQVIRRTDKEIE